MASAFNQFKESVWYNLVHSIPMSTYFRKGESTVGQFEILRAKDASTMLCSYAFAKFPVASLVYSVALTMMASAFQPVQRKKPFKQ
eukprot:scaffold14836_cov79-Cyclotella_meneghiniana.AAC.3